MQKKLDLSDKPVLAKSKLEAPKKDNGYIYQLKCDLYGYNLRSPWYCASKERMDRIKETLPEYIQIEVHESKDPTWNRDK